MRGHLQCRDTLAGNEGCPLKTGTTVLEHRYICIRTLVGCLYWNMDKICVLSTVKIYFGILSTHIFECSKYICIGTLSSHVCITDS